MWIRFVSGLVFRGWRLLTSSLVGTLHERMHCVDSVRKGFKCSSPPGQHVLHGDHECQSSPVRLENPVLLCWFLHIALLWRCKINDNYIVPCNSSLYIKCSCVPYSWNAKSQLDILLELQNNGQQLQKQVRNFYCLQGTGDYYSHALMYRWYI